MVEKGIGVVSIRPITRGSLILQEMPLIVQDADKTTNESVKDALDVLPRERQREFLALTNARRGEMKTLLGIFMTNALPCFTPSYTPTKKSSHSTRSKSYGIFPEASRFNSSCAPNVHFTYHMKLGVIRLYALRDILKGEELCIAYEMPILAPRAERWDFIEKKYGFRCECSVCSLVGKELLESDKRRKELAVRKKGREFIFTDPVGGLRMLRGAFDPLEKENLELLTDSFALDAYQICIELEMYEHGKAYLQQAYDATVAAMGKDSEYAERLRGELEDTEGWFD